MDNEEDICLELLNFRLELRLEFQKIINDNIIIEEIYKLIMNEEEK